MLRKKTIQGFLTGMLLILFGFSISPKIALHNLIAGHKDGPPISFNGEVQVTTSGFYCDVDNLVVESPFFFEHVSVTFNIPVLFAAYLSKPTHSFYSSDNFVSCLRGPPTIA